MPNRESQPSWKDRLERTDKLIDRVESLVSPSGAKSLSERVAKRKLGAMDDTYLDRVARFPQALGESKEHLELRVLPRLKHVRENISRNANEDQFKALDAQFDIARQSFEAGILPKEYYDRAVLKYNEDRARILHTAAPLTDTPTEEIKEKSVEVTAIVEEKIEKTPTRLSQEKKEKEDETLTKVSIDTENNQIYIGEIFVRDLHRRAVLMKLATSDEPVRATEIDKIATESGKRSQKPGRATIQELRRMAKDESFIETVGTTISARYKLNADVKKLGAEEIKEEVKEEIVPVLVDPLRKRAIVNGEAWNLEEDAISMKALQVLRTGEYVSSDELKQIAIEIGDLDEDPEDAVISRLNDIFVDHPGTIQSRKSGDTLEYRLRANIQVVGMDNPISESEAITAQIENRANEASSLPDEVEKTKIIFDFKGKYLVIDGAIHRIDPKDFENLVQQSKFESINEKSTTLLNSLKPGIVKTEVRGGVKINTIDAIIWLGQAGPLPAPIFETPVEPEVLDDEKLDKYDAMSLARLLSNKHGVSVQNVDAEEIFVFEIPKEIKEIMIELQDIQAHGLPRITADMRVAREQRVINMVSKMMMDENLEEQIELQDGKVKEILEWMWLYIQEEDALKKHFSEFLSSNTGHITRSGRFGNVEDFTRFVRLNVSGSRNRFQNSPSQQLGGPLKPRATLPQVPQQQEKPVVNGEVIDQQKQAEAPSRTQEFVHDVQAFIKSQETPVVTEKPKIQPRSNPETTIVTRTVEVTTQTRISEEVRVERTPKNKGPWSDFENRDPDIEKRIIEIAKSVINSLPPKANGNQVVHEFNSLTRTTQQIAVENGVVSPSQSRGLPQYSWSEIVIMAYNDQHGRNYGFQSRDYRKMKQRVDAIIPRLKKKKSK